MGQVLLFVVRANDDANRTDPQYVGSGRRTRAQIDDAAVTTRRSTKNPRGSSRIFVDPRGSSGSSCYRMSSESAMLNPTPMTIRRTPFRPMRFATPAPP